MAALARRLGVPFRSGGNFTASKVPDYQAAYESAISFMATMQAGVNFNLHTAGWLEGGLAIGYEKFILDEDQASMTEALHRRRRHHRQRLRARRDARRRAGPALPRLAAHAGQLRERLLALRALQQRQLRAVGGSKARRDAAQSARTCAGSGRLAEYEAPPLDEGIHEALVDWMDRRKASFPDSDV